MKHTKKLHIGLVSRYYPPDPGGGLALYTQQVARELTLQDQQVTIISSTVRNRAYVEEDQGVLILRIPQLKVYRRSLFGTTAMINSYRIANSIFRTHQQAPLDIVQCPATFYESLVFGRFYKSVLKIPLVVKFHENKETYERIEGKFKKLKAYRRNLLRMFMREAAYSADYWLGVSKSSLYSSLEYLNLPLHFHPHAVSPSPVDLNLFNSSSPPSLDYFGRFGLDNESPFLLYSGRLIYEKGLHLLVEAFLSEIAERFPELYLVIAGEHDYRQSSYEHMVRDMIKNHPAASRIIFAGRIPYNEMPYWFSRAQIFVAPSFCEPFGRIYIEAMACQTPVIGFNAGGPQEFITHGKNGYLVNDHTWRALSEGICHLLQEAELKNSLAMEGYKTVKENFGTQKTVANLIELYASLSSSNKANLNYIKPIKISPYVGFLNN